MPAIENAVPRLGIGQKHPFAWQFQFDPNAGFPQGQLPVLTKGPASANTRTPPVILPHPCDTLAHLSAQPAIRRSERARDPTTIGAQHAALKIAAR